MHEGWYRSWVFWTASGAAAVLLLGIVAWAVWWRLTAIQRHVTHTLRSISDRLIRDAIIPDGIGGFVPVDAIVLRDRRLYVLDIRDVEGAVFGSEKMDVWTAMGRKGRYHFNNPLRPMHDRLTAVKLLAPGLEAASRILFTSRGHFPKGRPEGVQLLEEFAQPLLRPKAKSAVKLQSDIETVWEQLREAANVPPGEERPQLSR
jgi:hypothetical protein